MFRTPPRGKEWMSWLYVAAWSLVIFATIPFARSIATVVGRNWGRESFRDLVLAVVVLSGGGAYLYLVRHRLLQRVGALWLALVGTLYAYFTLGLRAAPEECLHFVEYGALGILLFRALSHRARDPLVYLAAILIGGIIGTLDEIIQWLTPLRVFDYRDVRLNVLSGVLVQLAIAKGVRPPLISEPISLRSVRRVCVIAAVALAVLTFCLVNTPAFTVRLVRVVPALEYVAHKESAMTEYGYRHDAPGIGIFYSRLSLAELKRQDDSRADEAATILEVYSDPSRYAEFLSLYSPVTDPFLHELRVHLYRRDHYRAVAWKFSANRRLHRLHNTVIYREQQILERYFGGTLSLAGSYQMDPASVQFRRENSDLTIPYESPVSSGVITTFTRNQILGFVSAGFLALASIWLYSARVERRRRRARAAR